MLEELINADTGKQIFSRVKSALCYLFEIHYGSRYFRLADQVIGT
jgi:hypothetical protein